MPINYEAPPGTYTVRFTAEGQSTPTATTYSLLAVLTTAASTLHRLEDAAINEPDGDYTFVIYDSGNPVTGITPYTLVNGVEFVAGTSGGTSPTASAIASAVQSALDGKLNIIQSAAELSALPLSADTIVIEDTNAIATYTQGGVVKARFQLLGADNQPNPDKIRKQQKI